MGWIKDIWDIARDISKPALDSGITRHRSKKEKRAILTSFCNEFADHDANITSLLDYYSWHEGHNELRIGSGRLLSVTYKEITRLWSQSKLFAPYESYLVRHISNGGEISRIFALGPEYVDQDVRPVMMAVMYRHHILGFSPYVTSVNDLASISKNLLVSCETFGTTNDDTAYYLKFPVNSAPYFVRTIEKKYVEHALRTHVELLKRSDPFNTWYKRQPLQLTKSEIAEIELQCSLINEIAARHGVA